MTTSIVPDTTLDNTKNKNSNISEGVFPSSTLSSASSSFPVQGGSLFPAPPRATPTISAIANDIPGARETTTTTSNQPVFNIDNTITSESYGKSIDDNKNVTNLKDDSNLSSDIAEKLSQMDLNTSSINDTKDRISNKNEQQPFQRLFSKKQLKMETSLQNASHSLRELFSSFSNVSISSRLFNEAKGIVFLTVIKGGIGIGGAIGSGILLSRRGGKWSNPCGIGLTGLQIGFDIGIEKVDYILLLRDELALQMFQSKATLNIGGDISIAAGPLGRDINIGVVIDDTMATTNVYSYAIAKGAYVGVSLNGSWIKIRDDWNEEFYSRKISSKEILFNNDFHSNNNEYVSLIRTLNEYCKGD